MISWLQPCLEALQQADDRQAFRPAVNHVARLHQCGVARGPRPLLVHRTGQQQRLEGLLQVAVQVGDRQQRRVRTYKVAPASWLSNTPLRSLDGVAARSGCCWATAMEHTALITCCIAQKRQLH